MVDLERIERWSGGLGDDSLVVTVLDMMAVISLRLREEYEFRSCLEAATSLMIELTGWASIVLDGEGRTVAGSASSVQPHPEALAMVTATQPVHVNDWLCIAIPSRERHVLCADTGGGPVDGTRIVVMAEIVALTAFELRIEDVAIRERNRLWGDLAKEMLSGVDRQRVAVHAASVGHDLDAPHRVGLIADGRIGLSVEQVQSALRRAGEEALVAHWGNNIAVVLDESADTDHILIAVDQVVPGGRPWMGVSSVKPEGHDLSQAVAEANIALSFGQAAEETRTIDYCQLGVFRLFAPDGRWSELREFVDETIGQLIDYDREHGSDLVRTLDAYLRRDGSLNHVADCLLIHRSTLVYRLRRIRELLNVDIDDSEIRLDLLLAARAVAVIEATTGGHACVDGAQIMS